MIDLGCDVCGEVNSEFLAVDGKHKANIILQFISDVCHPSVLIKAQIPPPMLQVQHSLRMGNLQGRRLAMHTINVAIHLIFLPGQHHQEVTMGNNVFYCIKEEAGESGAAGRPPLLQIVPMVDDAVLLTF